jgi:hypothetical protein
MKTINPELYRKLEKILEYPDKGILILLAIYHGISTLYLEAEEDLDILYRHKILYVNDKGETVINYNLYKQSKPLSEIDKEIREHLEEYREIFRGIRKNSIGNKRACEKKLKKFMIETDLSMPDIIQLAQQHVSIEDYPSNADNFLYKTKKDSGVAIVVSRAKLLLESNQEVIW